MWLVAVAPLAMSEASDLVILLCTEQERSLGSWPLIVKNVFFSVYLNNLRKKVNWWNLCPSKFLSDHWHVWLPLTCVSHCLSSVVFTNLNLNNTLNVWLKGALFCICIAAGWFRLWTQTQIELDACSINQQLSLY